MPKRSKKHIEALKKVDNTLQYGPKDALELAVSSSYAKFDETVDVAVRLGVDPRHADQMVRGTVVLPNGLGKEVKVLVFAKGEKEQEAKDAGADYVGGEDLIDRPLHERQAALARRDMRWDDLEKYLLFPEAARAIRDDRAPEKKETCTMCGDFCAMKKGMEVFRDDMKGDKITPAN